MKIVTLKFIIRELSKIMMILMYYYSTIPVQSENCFVSEEVGLG